MREIKFRGKKISNGLWVYGYLTRVENDYAVIEYDNEDGRYNHLVYANTVGQYTGLKDANEHDIYEGDIVASTSGGFIYKVVYNDKRFASFGLWRKQDMFMHYFGESMEARECTVIGNIHDNPDLL